MIPDFSSRVFLVACCLLLVRSATIAEDDNAFVRQFCLDCHRGADAESGLDLQQLSGDLDSAALIRSWAEIHDRVDRGEMPPVEAEQPAAKDKAAFLSALRSRLVQADEVQREVVHRRMNRDEYENAVHDLLKIDVRLKQLLPEDQIFDGFSNNGATLAVSVEQLEAYLQTAELAIDAAIRWEDQPKTETVVVDAVSEVKPYFGQQYEHVDDFIVVYLADRSNYSKISTRSHKITHRGRYRVQFEAFVHNSDGPQTFLADADGFSRYYEVNDKPQTFTFEQTLSAGGVIQFHAVDLPGWINDPIAKKVPGVGFGPVTLTGPLYPTWPPQSHQQLFGEMDLEQAGIANAATILAKFLPRAFRRPVTEQEHKRYVALVQERLDAGRTFDEAIRVGLAAALCSPNFLYLKEAARPVGESIDGFEIASRLSFFLWNSIPDERLTQLAGQGRLRDPQTLATEVDRMLDDPKASRFVTNFTDHWLHLRRIHETTPDGKLFPDFDDHLKHSMVAESRAFFRHLLDSDSSIDLLLDSDFAMLNRRLARHYGVPDVAGATVHAVPLPKDSVRGGVMTQGAVLKVTANGTNTSPVVRGVWVLENIMGRKIPPPPSSVAAIEPDIRGAQTIRQQLVKHRSDESCNACHRHIDPPGFALESFDPVGSHREKYIRFQVNPDFIEQGWGQLVAGAEVDASGELPSGQPFKEIREFKQVLLEHRHEFARCLTEKLFAYALGREMGFSDRSEIERIAVATSDESVGLKSLIRMIVQSSTFQEK